MFWILAAVAIIIFSKLFNIKISDLIIMPLVVSPIAILRMELYKFKHNFDLYTGSIVFSKYNILFELFSVISSVICFVGLYYYAQDNGWWAVILLILSTYLISAPYYAFLKRQIIAFGEIVLIPLIIIGLLLFYLVVV